MIYDAATEAPTRSIMDVPAQAEQFSDAVEAALRQLRESQTRVIAHRLGERIQSLAKLGENWDGRGSQAADEEAIYMAMGALHGIAFVVREAGLPWLDPRVGLSEGGQVVFEWWNGPKKLTLYVGREDFDYVSSWGPDMDEQMEAGPLDDNLIRVWTWLTLAAEQ